MDGGSVSGNGINQPLGRYQQLSAASVLAYLLRPSVYNRWVNPMKFRLLATIMAVLACAHTAGAQATFPPETDNAALRYWSALEEVREPDDATRHLFEETVAGRLAWDETKLGPILDFNRDALQTMQRATKLPECNWGFDYRNGAAFPTRFGVQARLLSHLNELQGMREMAHGDSRTAVDTWLAGIRFGQ